MLEHFAKTGNLTESCQMSGLARSTHYKLLDINPKYAEAFTIADNASTDLLLKEARRRAITGVVEKTGWYKGVSGGEVTKYSDNLLMFLLKERRPEFRDKWEITGAGGQPLQITVSAYQPPEPPNKGYMGPSQTSPGKSPFP